MTNLSIIAHGERRVLRRSPCMVLVLPAALLVGAFFSIGAEPAAGELSWPGINQSARPWTRWWWHGSTVNKEVLTRCLEAYHEAGLGGVEITCIYGVRGEEDRMLDFLSDPWIDVVSHAINEAERLGMGVDLPPGSGWRIGGPGVAAEDGNANLVIEGQTVEAGSTFEQEYGDQRPHAVVAYGPAGEIAELTDRIDSAGKLRWESPAGDATWTVYTVGMRLSGERVKRPGPGGAGLNINPYAQGPVIRYLEKFAERIDQLPQNGIRASFHDSFEYEGSWCEGFLGEFHARRGYALEEHLPDLQGDGDADVVARVKCDYRETISDLVLANLITPWVEWCHQRGWLARNQAHGSPGNWLDLYAACDIPETESFGRLEGGDGHPLMFKFASSAAHVAGRPLTSSETATWLDEHFTVTLAMMKKIVDRQLLAGINHIFYHGTAYSPQEAAWPGWVFYASSQLNPQNPIWRDFPALNTYVTRCQSLLQMGQPDNDLLIYWPLYDYWQNPRGFRENLTVHNANRWFTRRPIGIACQWLTGEGYALDYVSDRLLETCRVEDGRIVAPGASYAAVLVPQAELMPAATLEQLHELAEAGAKILFLGDLPESPPGLVSDNQQQQFDVARLAFEQALASADEGESALGSVGAGQVLMSPDLTELMTAAQIRHERFTNQSGVEFIRREFADGNCYFLANNRDEPFDGQISLSREFRSAALMDPLDGRIGIAELDDDQRVRLQLAPGETVFLRTFNSEVDDEPWQYESAAANAIAIDGTWNVEFIAGGPELPEDMVTDELLSWTELAGREGERFAGTARYSIDFRAPAGEASRYIVDLGRVADSARVFVNGAEVGTLIGPNYRIAVDSIMSGNNTLTVEVTNVAANRIRDLDRRDVEWRIFHDINLVNIDYRRFDASGWPVRKAGLLGPVTMEPQE